MSYDDQKVKMGKEPVYVLELDLDVCQLTFGVNPCTATLAGPGLQCYNTRKTCQDLPNYSRGTRTFRFSSIKIDSLQQAGDPPTFPVLQSATSAPTVLQPGKGLGIRSSTKLTLTDFPWTDVGVDPYVRERTYNPDEQGTFFGRLLSRQEFYEGREMRVLQGFLDDDGKYDPANMKSRTYIIHRIAGPTSGGKVTIEGKDPLKFADNERRQWPRAARTELVSDINSTQTTFQINDIGGVYTQHNIAGQRYIRIGDEVMYIDSATFLGSNIYELTVTRATLPSIYTLPPEADDHKAETTVQPCWYFENERIDDLVFFLLNTGAGIDASFLPTNDWEVVIDFGLQNYLFSALIDEPTGIKQLLQELTEHTILLWWDERDREVKLSSIIQGDLDAGPFRDSDSIIGDSVQVTKDVTSRVSQTWIYHGLRSPLVDDKQKASSYQRVDIAVDADAETEDEYDDVRVRRVFSRWMPLNLATVASEIGNRLLAQYRSTKTVISMSMDPKDDETWTGDRVSVITRQVQGDDGAPLEGTYRILQVDEQLKFTGTKFKYVLQSENVYDRIGLITPDKEPDAPGQVPPPGAPDFPDYTPASEDLKDHYAFICYDTEQFLDGTSAYQIF